MTDLDDVLDELDWLTHDARTEINALVLGFEQTGTLQLDNVSPDMRVMLARVLRHWLLSDLQRRTTDRTAKAGAIQRGKKLRQQNGVST